LCKYSLHKKTQYNGIFDVERGSQHEFPPYILGDKICPLIYWIMALFKTKKNHLILELLFNKHFERLSYCWKCIWYFEKTFYELFTKFDLSVSFLSNVFTCYTIKYIFKMNLAYKKEWGLSSCTMYMYSWMIHKMLTLETWCMKLMMSEQTFTQ
jgi:hypothetical protein